MTVGQQAVTHGLREEADVLRAQPKAPLAKAVGQRHVPEDVLAVADGAAR